MGFGIWELLIFGAVLLPALAGVAMLVAGFAMRISQRRTGEPESRWPLSRKLIVAGGVLLAIAAMECAGLGIALALWVTTVPMA